MSTISSTPPIPADVQHFPAIPSYVVALSVVAAVVVTALVIFILYSCLVQRSKKRQGTIVERSPIRETERLREETAVELDVSLTDSAAKVTGHVKPKPSPSIFSRGDFLMEVLEGVENTTDLSLDGDVENTSHVCEDDRITVAMDDLDKDDNLSASQLLSTPPRQSATMDLFLENLSTPIVPPPSCTLGLRVREDCQADASTAALRGSISSGEGRSGSEGGQVIVCGDIEIYEDPVVGEIYEDPIVGEIYEEPIVDEVYEDPKVCIFEEVKVGIECHEDETDELAKDDTKEKNSSNEIRSTTAPVEEIPNLNLSIGFHERAFTIPEVDFKDDKVEDFEHYNASDSAIKEEESFSLEVGGGNEFAQDIKEGECYEYLSPPPEIPSPSLKMHGNTSPLISGQDASGSNTALQASTCLAELEVTPAPSIPVNIIPVSNQKHPNTNTLSAQLSHSTPTSLLHPLVSLHALPLTDRALSVSHLSLNRSGKHLPATPLSCNSEYSPVYNMQFGSARRLASDETATEVVVMYRDEVEGKEYKEEEVDMLTPGDASDVNQELKK